MPRRAKKQSGAHTGQILGLAGGLVFIMITVAVILYLFLGGGTGGGETGRSRTAANSDLNLGDYLDNANALRGNAYRVGGRVEEQLRWTPDRGRLISLDVKDGSGHSPVPVLVPQSFSHVNIEKGANLNLVVEVGNNGLLIARSIKSG